MDEETITVRGVRLPAQQIRDLQDEFGASLVLDSEGLIIRALDRALAEYRTQHGRDPELVNLREDVFHYYKHANIKLYDPVFHLPIEVRHKPAWFRMARYFKAVNIGRI